MKRNILLIPALAAAAAGLFLATAASPAADTPTNTSREHSGSGHMLRVLVRELDLSTDQRHALKDVMRLHQPVLRPLVDELRTERTALRSLIAAGPLDDAALAAQADRIAATNRDLVVASAHLRADLRKILTPGQAAKLDGWQAHAAGRADAGRARFREWLLEP